jgi:hypothetical protein
MFKKVGCVADDGIGNDRAMSDRKAGFIVMFFLAGGILISACAIRLDWILLRSKSWPRAEGRVVSVERVGHDRGLTYTYQYTANGKTHTSTNIEPGADSGNYPLNEDERVEVRYSTDANPYSFLMNTDIKSMILVHVIGFGWMAAGGLGLLGLVRGPLARTKPGDFEPRIDRNGRQ